MDVQTVPALTDELRDTINLAAKTHNFWEIMGVPYDPEKGYIVEDSSIYEDEEKKVFNALDKATKIDIGDGHTMKGFLFNHNRNDYLYSSDGDLYLYDRENEGEKITILPKQEAKAIYLSARLDDAWRACRSEIIHDFEDDFTRRFAADIVFDAVDSTADTVTRAYLRNEDMKEAGKATLYANPWSSGRFKDDRYDVVTSKTVARERYIPVTTINVNKVLNSYGERQNFTEKLVETKKFKNDVEKFLKNLEKELDKPVPTQNIENNLSPIELAEAVTHEEAFHKLNNEVQKAFGLGYSVEDTYEALQGYLDNNFPKGLFTISVIPAGLTQNEDMAKDVSSEVLQGYYDKIKSDIPNIVDKEIQKSKEKTQGVLTPPPLPPITVKAQYMNRYMDR